MRLARLVVLVSLFAVQLAAQPYVFRRDDRTRVNTMNLLENERTVIALLDAKGDFLWIRYDGREYVVRDVRTLAEIDAAFAPLRAISDEKRAVKERVRPLRQEAKSIERRLRREDDADTRAELERELESIQRELREAESELQGVVERKQRAIREGEGKMYPLFERALRNGLAVAR